MALDYNKDNNKPILVQFENGPLKDELKSSVNFQYLRATKSNKRMLLAECGNLVYTGNILPKQQSLVKYYIGVVDKKSSRIEDVQGVQLCTLKPKLRDDVSKKLSQDLTYKQKKDNLIEAFGSSKQKRLMSSRSRYGDVHESIDEKVASAAKKILLDSTISWSPDIVKETESAILPPRNIDAQTTSEIYNIDDIIPYQDYQLVKQYAKEMTFFDHSTLLLWAEENKYSGYILHLLSQLSQLPTTSAERKEKGCYICYLNYLLFVHKLTCFDLKKANGIICPDIPDQLRESFIQRFTCPDSDKGKYRCRPQKLKDKLYSYICILALMIENYEMDCNMLLKDLKLGVAKVSRILRAAGCLVIVRNQKPAKDSLPTETVMHATLKPPNEKKKNEASSDLPSTPKVKGKSVVSVKKEPE